MTNATTIEAKTDHNTAKELDRMIEKKLAGMTKTEIVESVRLLASDDITHVERGVRARLLNEYETRFGGEAVDRFMDELGF